VDHGVPLSPWGTRYSPGRYEMSMNIGSKAVKLPVELITLLESEGVRRNQGNELYRIYKEYLPLKTLADTMRERYQLVDRDMCMAGVILKAFEIEAQNMIFIREEHERVLKEVNELTRMLDGFQIYVKRSSKDQS